MPILLKLKACPKCGGDMEFSIDGWHCLQCGKIEYKGVLKVKPRKEKSGGYHRNL